MNFHLFIHYVFRTRQMFEPTSEELELLAEILTFTGTEASRILPTEKAIDVFERSDLGRNDLKEIWRLADKDRNGMLTSMELAVGLRLIGWVQAGEELGEHLIDLRACCGFVNRGAALTICSWTVAYIGGDF